MQPSDGSESLVIDCSITMAWYFKLVGTEESPLDPRGPHTVNRIWPCEATRNSKGSELF